MVVLRRLCLLTQTQPSYFSTHNSHYSSIGSHCISHSFRQSLGVIDPMNQSGGAVRAVCCSGGTETDGAAGVGSMGKEALEITEC